MRKPLAAIAVACAMLAGCGMNDKTADPNIASAGTSPSAPAKPKRSYYVVTYKMKGSADAGDFTYLTASGMEQHSGVRIPWHYTFKVRKHDFTALSVTVTNNGGSGTVRCEIYIDGKMVKAANGSGPYSSAECDHDLGM